MRTLRPNGLPALVLSTLLGACGGGEVKEEARPAGPPAPWETMSHEAKKAYMTEVVLPRMRPLFQAFDPSYFAEVTCATCHGIDSEDGEFDMPNEDLFALYPTGHDKQVELVRRQPKILRFMFNRVVPEMQALLGAAPYDPATGTGFSCFSCHPRGQ